MKRRHCERFQRANSVVVRGRQLGLPTLSGSQESDRDIVCLSAWCRGRPPREHMFVRGFQGARKPAWSWEVSEGAGTLLLTGGAAAKRLRVMKRAIRFAGAGRLNAWMCHRRRDATGARSGPPCQDGAGRSTAHILRGTGTRDHHPTLRFR